MTPGTTVGVAMATNAFTAQKCDAASYLPHPTGCRDISSSRLLFFIYFLTLTLSISSPLFLAEVYSIPALSFRFFLVPVRQLRCVLRAFSAIAPDFSSSISPAVGLADRWRRPSCISYTESNAITVSARGGAHPHTRRGAGTRRSIAITDN